MTLAAGGAVLAAGALLAVAVGVAMGGASGSRVATAEDDTEGDTEGVGRGDEPSPDAVDPAKRPERIRKRDNGTRSRADAELDTQSADTEAEARPTRGEDGGRDEDETGDEIHWPEEDEDDEDPVDWPEDARASPATPRDPARSLAVPAPTLPKPTDPLLEAARSPALTLLYDAMLAFDEVNTARLETRLRALEGIDPEAPETHAARGYAHFLRARYGEALSSFEAAGEVAGERGRECAAFAHFYRGEFRAALRQGEFPGRDVLEKLIDGPFRERYPLAASAMESTTPKGHYRVMTDLGRTPAALDDLEEKLRSAKSESRRARLLQKARRNHKGLKELAATMDQAYQAYDKLFAVKRSERIVPTVYLFAHKAGFDAFSKLLNAGETENVLGYYLPSYRVLVFYDELEGRGRTRGLNQLTVETLLHETFHQWFHVYVRGEQPPWFNEGLAEYFGISRLEKGKLHYGLVPKRAHSRLTNIRDAIQGFLPPGPYPLEQLLRASYATWNRRSAICYAQAWSFCHFLGSSERGRKVLKRYFVALLRGLDTEEAYREVFGKVDVAALDAEWRRYLSTLR